MDKAAPAGLRGDLIRILLVDDHPNTATTLARAISRLREGIEVLSATSGTQALEIASRGAIDILITDMMMPGMNGFELIERFQASRQGPLAHAVLMTAYDVPELREKARCLRVDDIIIKPVPTQRICHLIDKMLQDMSDRSRHIDPEENP